jgi:twitching motility protein PilU
MVLEQLFSLMADKKASDLLLSPNSPVTLKMQGVMVPVNQTELLTGTDIFKMLVPVCTQEQMAELHQTNELNVGIYRPGVGAFRLSAFKQKNGFAAVFRFIPPNPPTLEQLHIPASLQSVSLEQRGLILVCGSTGSGKSSTIAAMLEARNANKSGHILTVEDPVEFNFTPKKSVINQREIGVDSKDLATALKNGLRQTPDVIFIGETRDRETMTAAITYALSGHLVLTTLHANNSYHALSRIVSMYPPESRGSLLSDLSTAVKCIITQRLVKAVAGGRRPALEVMHNTQLTAELIEQGKMVELRDAIANSMAKGSQTFEQSLVALVNEGTVSREEAMAAADSPTNLVWLLNNQGMKAAEEAKDAAPIDRTASGAQYKEFKFG